MTDLATTPAPLTLDSLDEAARALMFSAARTASRFADTPVTDAELEQIWELAKWAPTAANSQPMRVLYVRTEAGRERLLAHVNEGNKAKVAGAPAVAVLATDTRFHEHLPTVFPHAASLREFFEGNETARLGSARFSGALQAGYFVLAVRAMGLAAGPMTGYDATGLDADFFPDGRHSSMMIVNIGHPAEGAWRDRLPRLPHDEVLTWA